MVSQCTEDVKCKECNKKHHSVFHREKSEEEAATYGAPGAIRPIVPVIVRSGNFERATYAMLDSAATSSAVLLETIDSVNGMIYEKTCKLSTFDKCESSQRDFASFEILPLDRSFSLEVDNALVGNILTTEKDKPPRNQDSGLHIHE